VETLRRWWTEMGRALYPQATRLLITADGHAKCSDIEYHSPRNMLHPKPRRGDDIAAQGNALG
jgi:hypothetical protein